ncbi:MAG: dCTP deaminase [Firmicutes bacterium]|nr:dCTP deaminase [Bacillota bacterium]
MILSGLEIKKQVQAGAIKVDDFDDKRLGPNSYNLRLHDELVIYEDEVLDMKRPTKTKTIKIPPEGFVLQPGRLYLGRTIERTTTNKFVPMLEGRSSVGRLGIFIHVTAGFGDVGFDGFWTLEIQCIHPVRIYAGVDIAQIYYHSIEGEYTLYSDTKNASGKYHLNDGIQPSMMYKDFED